jgi:hypothetical protein
VHDGRTRAYADTCARAQTDPEVREKAAALVQEWAVAIGLSPYRDTYQELLGRGVPFPPRDPRASAPIHTPPQTHGAELSDADAAAIAAAVQEVNAEVESAEEAAARARERDVAQHHHGAYDAMHARKAEKRQLRSTPEEYMSLAAGPSAAAGGPAYGQGGPAYGVRAGPASPYGSPPGGASLGVPVPRGAPPPAADLVASASATVQVLHDVLRCIDPGRPAELLGDELAAQLADSCRGPLSSGLQAVAATAQDEALLCAALAANDELCRVLEVFDYLLASAQQQQRAAGGAASGSGGGHGTGPAAAAPPPPLPPKPARLEAASPGSVWGGAASGTGPPEEARVGQLRLARTRGAALLAEASASVRLPPPPSMPCRVPQGPASASAGGALSPPPPPPPSNHFDMLAQLSPPSAVSSLGGPPAGFSAGSAFTNPLGLLDAGDGLLASDMARQAVLLQPSPASTPTPPSAQAVFDSLPPVVMSPPASSAGPPPSTVLQSLQPPPPPSTNPFL